MKILSVTLKTKYDVVSHKAQLQKNQGYLIICCDLMIKWLLTYLASILKTF